MKAIFIVEVEAETEDLARRELAGGLKDARDEGYILGFTISKFGEDII